MYHVFNEGVELYNYISQYCGSQYFPELERRLLNTLYNYANSYRKSILRQPGYAERYGTHGTRLPFDRDFDLRCLELCEQLKGRMAEYAIRHHGDKLTIARCGNCSAVLRTPVARQCVRCGHSWFRATA